MKKLLIIFSMVIVISMTIPAQATLNPHRAELVAGGGQLYGLNGEYAIPINNLTIAPTLELGIAEGGFYAAIGAKVYPFNALGRGLNAGTYLEFFPGDGSNATILNIAGTLGYRLNFFKLLTASIDLGYRHPIIAQYSATQTALVIKFGLGIAF
jgi:hypothetical protein